MTTLTAEQLVSDLDKLRHMLGVDADKPRKRWCYRNYYNANYGGDSHASMERLTTLGMAEEYRPNYWRATEAGCKAIGLTDKETERALHGD